MRTTTYALFAVLIVALIGAVLIWIFEPLEAKGKEDKGGIPSPTPTVSAKEITTNQQVVGTPTPIRGRRYTNKAGGYSLIVPDGWRVSGSGPYIIFLVRQSQQREGERPSFRVQASLAPYDVLKENLSKGGTSPNCTEQRHSIQVDGLTAERWVCNSSDGQDRWTYVTIERESMFYWLGGPIAIKDLERDFSIFEGILFSIQFIEIEAPPPVTPTAISTSTPTPAP